MELVLLLTDPALSSRIEAEQKIFALDLFTEAAFSPRSRQVACFPLWYRFPTVNLVSYKIKEDGFFKFDHPALAYLA